MILAIYLLKALSKLPIGILYGVSGFIAFLLKNVFGYRKAVIAQNLHMSFPEKSDSEIKQIRNEYYAFMADLMVETIKLWSMNELDLIQRISFKNKEVLEQKCMNQKPTIIMMGHSGNWEWASHVTQLLFKFQIVPVYRKIKNESFDQFYLELRSKFKTKPVRDQEAFSAINAIDGLKAVAMLADQTPSAKKGWWLTFLNQTTPFYRGSEILTHRLQYDVVFAHIHRTKKRGYYEIVFEDLSDTSTDRGALTKRFASCLEREIKKDPANWLWSHKRWKHSPKENAVYID